MSKPRLFASTSAASETTGTILLLVIAIALASVFALTIFTLPPPLPSSHATLQAYVPLATNQLVIEHRGGPPIPLKSLTATVTVNGVATSFIVGDNLGATWSVRSASGVVKISSDSFVAGDQATYTDPQIFQHDVSVTVVNGATTGVAGAALALSPTKIQDADAAKPQFISARTNTTTLIVVTFSEPLRNMTDLTSPAAISAKDFAVENPGGTYTITGINLLGNSSSAEFTVSPALPTGALPWVNSTASPAYTSDLAGNAFTASASVRATDGVAPGLDAPATSGVGTGGATVTWNSDEAAPTNLLYCGPTQSLGFTAITGTGTGTAHTAVISGLSDNQQYFCQVTSADAAGNVATSSQFQFTTTQLAISSTSSVNFLSLPSGKTVTSGQVSTSFTVSLNNASGLLNAPQDTTVNLQTNSTAGQFFSDAAGTLPIATVTITSGTSSATFYYLDYRDGGNSVVTATSQGTVSAATSVSVSLKSGRTFPYHLVFTALPTMPVTNAVDTAGFTVSLRDSFDRAIIPRWALTVNLSTSSAHGSFTDGVSAITSVVINGASSASFDYLDTRGGNAVVLAYANNTQPAAAAITVTGSIGLDADTFGGFVTTDFGRLNAAQTWGALQTFGSNASLDGSTLTTGNVSAARLPTAAAGVAGIVPATGIANATVATSAAIAYSKLALSGSITGADLATSAVDLAGTKITGVLPNGNVATALTGKTYNGLTVTSTTGTLTIANAKTATFSDSFSNAGPFTQTGAGGLTLATGASLRTVTLAGDLTTSGANALTLTTTGATSVTLPTSGTLLASGGVSGADITSGTVADARIASALTGKTYNGLTLTSTTGTLTIGAAKTVTHTDSFSNAGPFTQTGAGGITLATGASLRTITLAGDFTTTGAGTTTLGNGGQTLAINYAGGSAGTFTLPGATDTLAGLGTTQTWTASQTFQKLAYSMPATYTVSSTLAATDTFVRANGGGSAITITLPAANSVPVGKVLIIKNTGTSAAVTVSRGGADTINTLSAIGASTLNLAKNGAAATFVSDGVSVWEESN